MFGDYITRDLDNFDPDSVNTNLDSNIHVYSSDDYSSSLLLDDLDNYIDNTDSSLLGEEVGKYNFNNEVEDETAFYPHSSKSPSFTGHSLGWNGRCSICNCGKWAGYGDTCANCGHFYNKHI